jgi:predicted ribosomally synthesized peptide with SipW-like signal peptide
MTDDKLGLSRRKMLAGLGAMGVASAGAGLGTTAYFSDDESFEGNILEAGEFDLKVDWQHTYHGAMVDDVYGSAGRPYVSAYPDEDGDGVRDEFLTRGEIADANTDLTAEEVEEAYRDQFADLPDDFEEPLISLDDVKPGDRGCVSLSLHLFDNPGHIWLGARNVSGSENGQSEPEAEVDETAEGMGELAESIDARVWYDDGNCELDSGFEGESAEVVAVLDTSGSMSNDTGSDATSAKWQGAKDGVQTLSDALGSNADFALVTYDSSANDDLDFSDDVSTLPSVLSGLSTGGQTNISAGLTTANGLFTGTADSEIIVLLTNGNPTSGNPVPTASTIKGAGVEIYTVAYGSDANSSILSQIATNASYAYSATDIAAIESVFAAIGQSISGEAVIEEGTLAEVLAALEGGIHLDSNLQEEGVQCFVNSTTRYIAMDWEVPTTVGNEIQTDTLEFDLALEAEQCRHNETPENPFEEVQEVQEVQS